MNANHLGTYVNDHLAESVAAMEPLDQPDLGQRRNSARSVVYLAARRD
jgi:hypothetical protein